MYIYINFINTLDAPGPLSAVGSLTLSVQNSTIFLNWTAPFTLDINGIDEQPDITYCVNVALSNSTLYSECGITETEYIYSNTCTCVGCINVTFTVIPVNVVGNGTVKNTVWKPSNENHI